MTEPVRLRGRIRRDGTVLIENQCHRDGAACADLAKRLAAALGPGTRAEITADAPRVVDDHTQEHEHEA